MKSFFKTNFLSVAVSLCTAVAMLILLLFPSLGTGACWQGLLLWAKKIVPTLFPFFFLSALLVNLGKVQRIAPALTPLTSHLFHTGGLSAVAYVVGAFSGYPVGSKLIADFVERGQMEQSEAVRASTFCTTAGPLFVVGSVGTATFGSPSLGGAMLLSHLLSGLLVGICFRGRKRTAQLSNKPLCVTPSANPLYDSVYSAVISTLMVGGFISLFSVLSELLFQIGILTPMISAFSALFSHVEGGRQLAKGLAFGILECTGGCAILAEVGTSPLSVSLACALISFGGLCIFTQAAAHLTRAGIPVKPHFLAKLLHGVFAFGFCLAILSL